MNLFGHEFANPALAERALTTPSFRMDVPDAEDNQRLEFLGDAVLGLLSAERLVAAYPDEPEGALTVRRTHMVSTAALCAVAERLGLAERLKRNRAAVRPAKNAKVLADAVEAVIGAAYLDGGLAAAREVFATLALDVRASEGEWSGNPKGELQVRAQAMKPPRHPVYTLVRTVGRAHEPVFTARVDVEGVGSAEGTARTRKEAEAQAARMLLEDLA